MIKCIILILCLQTTPVHVHKISSADAGKVILFDERDLIILKLKPSEICDLSVEPCEHTPRCRSLQILKQYDIRNTKETIIVIKACPHFSRVNFEFEGVVTKVRFINNILFRGF